MAPVLGLVLGLGVGLGIVVAFLGITTEPTPRAPWRSRLTGLIERSGATRVTPGGLLAACVGAGGLAFLVVLTATAVPIIALVAGVAVGLWPIAVLRRRAARRVRLLRASWPDGVDTLASAVKAGMSLPEAVADLARRGPQPLRAAFAEFTREYRATGSFEAALVVLRDSVRDPVADRVVASLRIARDVGGTDLGRVLATLSAFLRADARTRGEIEARQSWTVNAARVAVAAPWVTLLLLCTRPEAVQAFSTPGGGMVIAVSTALTVLAYRVMLSIGRLPDDPRMVRQTPRSKVPV